MPCTKHSLRCLALLFCTGIYSVHYKLKERHLFFNPEILGSSKIKHTIHDKNINLKTRNDSIGKNACMEIFKFHSTFKLSEEVNGHCRVGN
jgi:hypothetical protein